MLNPLEASQSATENLLVDGWTKSRLGDPDVATLIMGQSPDSSTYNRSGIGLPFFQGKVDFGLRHPKATTWCSSPLRIAESCDILVSVRAPVGNANIAIEKCCIGRGLAALRPGPKAEKEFLFYTLLHHKPDLDQLGTGATFKAINKTTLIDFEIYLPTLPEQRAIAAVLSKIQAAIEVQEKIVATLKELKAATMAKLFREGLRGEPLKQTEIGEIPESWEVVPLGDFTESSAFGPRFSAAFYSENGNVATLRTTDIDEDGLINYATMPKAELDLDKVRSHLLKDGDLVITRSGTCGIAAVFETQPRLVLPGAFLIRVRLSREISPHFLRLWINSPLGRPQIQQLASGAVQKNISGTSLATLPIPVPKKTEQEEIIRELRMLEQRLFFAQQHHNTLKSLFSSMLHLLMSGQVRVNNLKLNGERHG